MGQHVHNDGGFTLPEVLIALALNSLVAIGLMSIFWFGNLFMQHHQAEAEIRYSARQAAEHMTRDIRNSRQLQICTSDNRPVPVGVAGKRLQLTLGTDERVDYYIYPPNRTLYRYNLTAHNNAPIAINIADLEMLCPQPGLLDIKLTALAGDHSYHLHTAFKSRLGVGGDR